MIYEVERVIMGLMGKVGLVRLIVQQLVKYHLLQMMVLLLCLIQVIYEVEKVIKEITGPMGKVGRGQLTAQQQVKYHLLLLMVLLMFLIRVI